MVLLYFTPFLVSAVTLPLTVWTYSIVPVYLVWDWAQYGARWRVPDWLMALEYVVVLAASSLMLWRSREEEGHLSRWSPVTGAVLAIPIAGAVR